MEVSVTKIRYLTRRHLIVYHNCSINSKLYCHYLMDFFTVFWINDYEFLTCKNRELCKKTSIYLQATSFTH